MAVPSITEAYKNMSMSTVINHDSYKSMACPQSQKIRKIGWYLRESMTTRFKQMAVPAITEDHKKTPESTAIDHDLNKTDLTVKKKLRAMSCQKHKQKLAGRQIRVDEPTSSQWSAMPTATSANTWIHRRNHSQRKLQ